MARVISACAQVMADALDIRVDMIAGFGISCGALVTGYLPVDGLHEARDLTATALRGRVVPGAALAVALQGEAAEFWPVFWREAGPVLGMIAEVFAGWGKDPASHVELRAAWRRGRSIEMSGG